MSNRTQAGGSATKGRSCLFYGCLTVAIVGVVLAVAGFLGVRHLWHQAVAFVEEQTDTTPAKLPHDDVSQAEAEALRQRMAEFEQAMNSGQEVEPLVLTGRDINALIASSPDTAKWKDWMYVSIENDQIKAQVSLPLDELIARLRLPGLSRLKGRYLNGAAALRASLQNGMLNVTLESLEVKGQLLPENIMAQLRRENLARDAQNNPDLAKAIAKLKSIEVADGKVTVTAAGNQ